MPPTPKPPARPKGRARPLALAAWAWAAAWPAGAAATRPWADQGRPRAPAAGRQAPPDVVCRGPRIFLGCLMPSLGAPWEGLDVGAAAAPLATRQVTAGEIDERVRQAGMAPVPVPMPAKVVVGRAGQEVPASRLAAMVRAAAREVLPDGALLGEVVVARGVQLGEGALEAILEPTTFRDGRQTVLARVRAADGTQVRTTAAMTLDYPQATREVVVARGQEVTVRVVVNKVLVQKAGTAQEDGALGDAIAVLPEAGARVLRGRVVDAHTVEVHR